MPVHLRTAKKTNKIGYILEKYTKQNWLKFKSWWDKVSKKKLKWAVKNIPFPSTHHYQTERVKKFSYNFMKQIVYILYKCVRE